MESSSRRPAVVGVGKAPGLKKIVVWSVILLTVAAVGGTLVLVSQLLMRFDSGGQAADDAKPWADFQQRQYRRGSEMHKLYQRAKRIWKNIDALQEQVDAYQRVFNDLKVNEAGKRLTKDKWVVRYFIDKWGEPLPPPTVAEECRVRLNELMLTAEEALAITEPKMKRPAYEIPPEVEEEVESIEFEVDDAKKEYTRHRLALDALVRMVTEGRPVTEKTLGEVAEDLRGKKALKEMGHSSSQEEQLPGESSGTSAGRRNRERAGSESSSGKQSQLYHEVEDSQSDRE